MQMDSTGMYLSTEGQATTYNKFRPSPPNELTTRIIEFLKEQFEEPLDTAIDVGCGSGQSTAVLGPYFKRVIGIDSCQLQLTQAKLSNTFSNVEYRLGSSDLLDVPDRSVHLVTAGQSAHFFEMSKFYAEVERVLLPGGVLAIYGYSLPIPSHKGTTLQNIMQKMFKTTMHPYISNKDNHVYIHRYNNEVYKKFPFTNLPLIREDFDKTVEEATVQDLIGYAKSWSAYNNIYKTEGESVASQIMDDFQNEIMTFLNMEEESPEHVTISITFPYVLLMGRKDA